MLIGVDRFGWNDVSGRYYDRLTGRYVSRDAVRTAVDDMLVEAEHYVRQVSDELRTGRITLAQWQEHMRDVIKLTTSAAEAAARGGWQQLTSADAGRIGAQVRTQYRYLEAFTQELRDGLATDGRFLNRAAMYAKSARPFFHDEQRELLESLDYTEERNVLHPAEHCDECLDQSAAGWVPIGTLIPIGERTCLGNDRCSMRYR